MSLQLDLPKANGLFITGTDTGVGKTLVTGGIARTLYRRGVRPGPFKPIASGCRREREGLISDDAVFLSYCAESDLPLSVINPVTYAIPAAPVVCVEREHRPIDFDALSRAYGYLTRKTDFVLVEGVGGVRVPLCEDVDVLDLMQAFRLPVLIVTRPNLGTINHTLLTLDAVRAAGLPIAGLVMNGYDPLNATLAEETVANILTEWGRVPLLAVLPLDPTSSVEEGRLGNPVLDALVHRDWLHLPTTC